MKEKSTSDSPLPSLKEERLHGSYGFRCGYYAALPGAEPFTVPMHWHEEIEIICFQKGSFTLEVNMEQYRTDSESLFFVSSGELHRITGEQPCQESAFVFSPYLLNFVSNDDMQNRIILPLIQGDLTLPRRLTPEHRCFRAVQEEYRRLISHCRSESAHTAPSVSDQLFIKAALLNILGILSANSELHTAKENKNESIESVKTVLSYIHTHYTEKIYVRDLARIVNLNDQYFCRLFRKVTGQSPIAYLNSYRIRRSIDLLSQTQLSVTDICLGCGFHNLGNFLREFRLQTGTTPLQYRKISSVKKSK